MENVKTIFSTAMVILVILSSCNKENIHSSPTEIVGQSPEQLILQGLPQEALDEEHRSYVWVYDKLDCSQPGSGCIVKSTLYHNNGEIDLSVIQVLQLLQIGSAGLQSSFLHHELVSVFPSLYEDNYIIDGISNGTITCSFEFPYLIINDLAEPSSIIYDYRRTLNNTDVAAALANVGEYTMKIQLNTNTNIPAVWKCVEPGDNCKVSSVAFNPEWLASNPEYLHAPTMEDFTNVTIDGNSHPIRVVVETTSGQQYGIQF